MMRSSKLRTKIALTGGAAVLAGAGLFAAAGAANATTPANPSHSFQVADSGQATAGKAAPSSIPATMGLPEGGTVAKSTLLPGTSGSAQASSPNASATDVAPATIGTGTDAADSFQVANSGQATGGKATPSSIPATVGLPKGGTVANGSLLPSTPGSAQVTSPNASATDVAPATVGAGD